MTDSHLLNTLKLLKRVAKDNHYSELCEAYSVSSMLQGDMAVLDCDRAIYAMEKDPEGQDLLPDIFFNLLEDAQRRKLDIKKFTL